ncbi:MAG: endo-1,4-beta-xylanase [Planctomycetota bacterium]
MMLSFAVFDEQSGATFAPAQGWDLADAHMFGPDGIPVPAELRIEQGRILCDKPSAEPAGLALPFPHPTTSGADANQPALMLATCLLPERDTPYLLSLELARQRIMTLLNKLEDWQLVDLAPEQPAIAALERARLAFTEALVSHRLASGGQGQYSAEAERLSRLALAHANDASGALVAVSTERGFPDRVSGAGYLAVVAGHASKPKLKPGTPGPPLKSQNDTGLVLPGKPAVAASINPAQFSAPIQQAVTAASDLLALPMRWRDLEPDEGRYSFAATDRWIEWAVRRAKVQVSAGPVITFARSDVPDWLYIWEHDYETLREVVYEHVKNVITRYRRTVPRWTILSGLNRNENIQLTFEQMMDLTRMTLLLARKLHPQGKIAIEVDHPFASEPGHKPRSLPGALYAEMVQQAGMGVDAWGIRLELERPKPGRIARDLMHLSAALDRYALLDRPLAVTAVSPAVEPGSPPRTTEEIQWLAQAFELIVSKPSVLSLVWQERELPAGAKGPVPGSVILGSGDPRASVRSLAELRKRIREAGQPQPSPSGANVEASA